MMKIDREQKRLNAIRLKLVIFPTKCRCCGEEYVREKMWQVYRWGINKTRHEWNYCQNCMTSKQDVLNEVDTDDVMFGIAEVDSFNGFVKKDYRRMNLRRDRAFGRAK